MSPVLRNLSVALPSGRRKLRKENGSRAATGMKPSGSGETLPTKELIDPVTPDNPVFLSRYDGHSALANSAALKLAGVTAQTPDPPGGAIVRDAPGKSDGRSQRCGKRSGVLKVIPPLSHDQRIRAVEARLWNTRHRLGVTSVQNMDPEYADIAASAYAELLQSGELTTRIYAAPLITQLA